MGAYTAGNRVLDALSAAERADVVRKLEVIELKSGDVTHAPGRTYEWVVFPVDAVLAVVATLEGGETCEIGTVGREGASGVEIAFGAPVLRTTLCQVPGRVARLRTELFLDAIDRNPGLNALIRAGEKARMFFLEQMIVCNTVHALERRYARWLLLLADRAARDEYPVTHEFVSMMLGVRRSTITDAAAHLQVLGAISYRRGHVHIVDRAVLRSFACECYAATTEIFDAAIDTWGKILPRRYTERARTEG